MVGLISAPSSHGVAGKLSRLADEFAQSKTADSSAVNTSHPRLANDSFEESMLDRLDRQSHQLKEANTKLDLAISQMEEISGLVSEGQKVQKQLDDLNTSTDEKKKASLRRQQTVLQKSLDTAIEKIDGLGREVQDKTSGLSHEGKETPTLGFASQDLGRDASGPKDAKAGRLSDFATGGSMALGTKTDGKAVIDRAMGELFDKRGQGESLQHDIDSDRTKKHWEQDHPPARVNRPQVEPQGRNVLGFMQPSSQKSLNVLG